jgi:hypothetical protein
VRQVHVCTRAHGATDQRHPYGGRGAQPTQDAAVAQAQPHAPEHSLLAGRCAHEQVRGQRRERERERERERRKLCGVVTVPLRSRISLLMSAPYIFASPLPLTDGRVARVQCAGAAAEQPAASNLQQSHAAVQVQRAHRAPGATPHRDSFRHGRTENGWPLNDAQRPTSRAVRVAINMGYNRVRGIVGTSRETVA